MENPLILKKISVIEMNTNKLIFNHLSFIEIV